MVNIELVKKNSPVFKKKYSLNLPKNILKKIISKIIYYASINNTS